ncbi:antibiotic biosynthesis monooxygenase [Agrobacterium sp. MOPV5]|uniref:putative quinol monooxygenase n=1 Tax=Agrobacterium leguminum TaxID=2792015 RepID=UPI0018C2B028|nr:putative quinol monooxygenase [Agrobacterium leguminum]MBG0511619.1 antibiotic biosynthesis monooxygenase [Agrobacterium leguminum]
MTAQSVAPLPTPSYGEQLTLIAFIRAKKGMGDELGRRLGTLVEPARAEAGNVNYDLHRSNEDPDVWVLYENWKQASDLDAHFEYQYMKDFLAVLPEVLDGDMDLRRCAMVTPIAAKA